MIFINGVDRENQKSIWWKGDSRSWVHTNQTSQSTVPNGISKKSLLIGELRRRHFSAFLEIG